MKYKKSQLAWISYDFANSAFHLLIPTVLFPLYFKKVLSADVASSDLYWSLVVSVPILICGILGPFIGAVLDKRSAKRIFFLAVTLVTIVCVFILGTIPPTPAGIPIAVFAICLLFFNFSEFAYNSFLPSQISGKGTALFSGVGWGLGYLGGIICMIPVFFLIQDVNLPEAYPKYQQAFLLVAAFYLIFSLPSFFHMQDPLEKTLLVNTGGSTAFKAVLGTLRNWRTHREIFLFLFALYLINDGLATLVFFTSIFASETLGMSTTEIMKAFLYVQVVAIPGTIFFSWVGEKLGYMRVFMATVITWILIALLFQIVKAAVHLYALSVLVGLVIGTTPALGRAILSSYLADTKNAGEIFGFHTMASRVSAVMGPLLFGVVSTYTGSRQLALGSLIVFFVLALLILIKLKNLTNPDNS